MTIQVVPPRLDQVRKETELTQVGVRRLPWSQCLINALTGQVEHQNQLVR
jgi:hypothetical protein